MLKSELQIIPAGRRSKANIKTVIADAGAEVKAAYESQGGILFDITAQQALNAATRDANLANSEIEKTLTQRFQAGVATIKNRGVVSGCTVTKSQAITRGLETSSGVVFFGGCTVPVDGQVGGAGVPDNTTDAPQECYVYLGMDGDGAPDLVYTALGEEPPLDSVVLYRLDIPAGNTAGTDMHLDSCTLVDLRRIEPGWPAMLTTSPVIYVALPFDMADADYQVDVEVVTFSGSGFQLGYAYVGQRASNGFVIYYNGAADEIEVRWTAKKMTL